MRTRCILAINLLSICFCLGTILASVLLRPNLEGYGTHKSLGLPSCMTATLFGLKRCPSCGLTTAFALIGKGDFQRAINVHPWAGPFYVLVLVFFGTSFLSLIRNTLKIWLLPVSLTLILGISYAIYWLLRIFN